MSWIDWMFPRECLGCGKEWSYLCFSCKKELVPHPELCPACHKASADFQICRDCARFEKMALDGLVVGFSYQKSLKKLILKLKFYHKKDVGKFLSERLALLVQTNHVLSQYLMEGKLIVSFVPSHWYRHYFVKWYNQSQILAEHLAQELLLPCSQLVEKKKATVSQLALNRQERLKNLTSAFSPLSMEKVPKNACIVIVDDVTTTGATLDEVAKVIKNSRPDLKVRGLVVARHTS